MFSELLSMLKADTPSIAENLGKQFIWLLGRRPVCIFQPE
jgi:hypothetical protein